MTDLEKEIRANKLAIIKLLLDKMVQLKFNEYKDFKIEEDKPVAYLDATIDILNVQIKKAEISQAKLVSFDKLEQDRKNLTPEELKQLEDDQNRINEKVDSFLATLEPRASLKANVQAPNTIILRYRGNGIDPKFTEKYPFGVLM
ncbi:hypothetical protein LCGC14_2075220 [marine sediment metagenome]|uniref:Uncharacterized protein n=1 Tax=marine sediment metagenome TaxID=412755 RepID=A0A0F9EH39_9ZZZZ